MKKPGRRVQYAALPYRRAAGGVPEIMLVTSRRSKRWIIPKGWPMKRKTPHAAAAREALEEAGVTGSVGRKPLGSYSYRKRLKDGRSVVCKVKVFPLEVSRQRKSWPEEGKRRVKWFSPARAARLVTEPVLKELIRAVRAGAPKGSARSERKTISAHKARGRATAPAAKRATARSGRAHPHAAARKAVAASAKTAHKRTHAVRPRSR
jgi:8-oxo-dGTP pyrophosphatase MutT (NUDIX family)